MTAAPSGSGSSPVQGDRITLDDAETLVRSALSKAGAGDAAAGALAPAFVRAEAEGLEGVGLAHALTYCDGLKTGRIDGRAEPSIERPSPGLIRADAKGGVGHLAFDRAFEDLVAAARGQGIAAFTVKNGFTNAALGWFVGRLAGRGLAGLAATNGGPALLAGSGATTATYCTNPLAFAVSCRDGPPLVIDQSSSATAYVNLKLAAGRGEAIPAGWALDDRGCPTTDARAALNGVLLPFGGARGGNIALMVELLAAGLSGANWSLDAPSFLEGDATPGVGLFVLAIDADTILGADAGARVGAYLERIAGEGVHIPGKRRALNAEAALREGMAVAPATLESLRRIAEGNG